MYSTAETYNQIATSVSHLECRNLKSMNRNSPFLSCPFLTNRNSEELSSKRILVETTKPLSLYGIVRKYERTARNDHSIPEAIVEVEQISPGPFSYLDTASKESETFTVILRDVWCCLYLLLI